MATYCQHCGSRNHQSFDCSHQDKTYTPKPEELAQEPPPKPAPPPPAPEPMFEPKLRWPGAPPICTAENLPAFQDEDELKAYRQKHGCGEVQLLKKWQCAKCGGLHYLAKPISPSGNTSGNARESVLPKNFVPFIRKLRPSAFQDSPRPAELPKQPEPPPQLRPAPRRATTTATVVKVHPLRKGEDGSPYHLVELRLEGGAPAKTFLHPDYGNFAAWKPLLAPGSVLGNLWVKSPGLVDADSVPKLAAKPKPQAQGKKEGELF